jgi:uncharacterized membrane protein SirB2
MMSDLAPYYLQIKLIHVTTVVITGGLFLLRFLWMLQGKLAQRGRWSRTLPHVNDSLLLLSGLGLAWLSHQFPLQATWLTTKLCLLLVYILLGSVALKRGKTLLIRRWSGFAALACYLYIVSVALTRHPLPDLHLLLQRLFT